MFNADSRPWQIKVPADQLFPLRDWLTAEDALRGTVAPLRSSPGPGEMGGAVEVLEVALGSGGVGVVLIRALCAWLTQRRSDVTVTVTVPSGDQVRVDVKRARDPEAVIREVGSLLEHATDGAEE